jgi:hypothetical protein
VCDVAESCTGNSAACPGDSFKASTTECRASAGVCDVAESCTGNSAACPGDGFKASTTECRASAGACDIAESCPGNGAACPADGFKAATTECRASAGACDIAESCPGNGAACPADGFKAATTECRASAGVCDVAESCTGNSAACPADGFKASTTECRASAGACDIAESCPGNGVTCPADGFKSATTECRPAVDDVCDVSESCTGNSASCPTDEKRECAFVTNSALCQFDVGDFCADTPTNNLHQFNANFSPDVQTLSYKQNSTNPGQFFYNLLYGGGPTTLKLKVPYPFITQGATPLHIYDGAQLQLGVCLVPGPTLQSTQFAITRDDWINGAAAGPERLNLNCPIVPGPSGALDWPVPGGSNYYCTFDVPISQTLLDATLGGQVYVNLHVDFGFKGPQTDMNPASSTADRYSRVLHAGPAPGEWDGFVANTAPPYNGLVGLSDCREFKFEHDTGTATFSDKVQNTNVFKKLVGVVGNTVNTLTGAGTPDVPVFLINPAGQIVAKGATDKDGYYLLDFKHTGKAATYTLKLGTLTQFITLQANGWAEVSYDPGTGQWTLQSSWKK